MWLLSAHQFGCVPKESVMRQHEFQGNLKCWQWVLRSFSCSEFPYTTWPMSYICISDRNRTIPWRARGNFKRHESATEHALCITYPQRCWLASALMSSRRTLIYPPHIGLISIWHLTCVNTAKLGYEPQPVVGVGAHAALDFSFLKNQHVVQKSCIETRGRSQPAGLHKQQGAAREFADRRIWPLVE